MEPVLRDRLAEFGTKLGAPLTDTAIDQISAYLDLLRIWNRTTRLTGPSDDQTLVDRHVIDSLAIVANIPPGGTMVDIGSGAGFPGLVVAIARPDVFALLVEPRRRRVSFLSEVTRTVKLPQATVICARAEDLRRDQRLMSRCDVAVSRAVLAADFLQLAAPFLRPGGIAIVMQTHLQAQSSPPSDEGFEAAGHADYNLPDTTARRLLLYRRVC